MYSLTQIIFITNSKKKQDDHPFLGIAARRVYMRAIELNPLTSPDLRRFPSIANNPNKSVKTKIIV